MLTPEELMDLAIEKARAGIASGQSPFGCAIALGDRILAVSHNTVLETTDITAHAEVNAIRVACQELGDIFLSDALVATTCEPCPMCMSALHWARVDTVYYGATIDDAAEAGFNELRLPAEDVLRIGGSKLRLESGVRRDACREVFQEWMADPNRNAY